MLVLFVVSNGDRGIEKNHIHVELHKDTGSLAEGPEQLVIKINETRECLKHLKIFKGSVSSWSRGNLHAGPCSVGKFWGGR